MKYKLVKKDELDSKTDEIMALLIKADSELSDKVFGDDDSSIDDKIITWEEAFELEKLIRNAFTKMGDFRLKELGHL